MKTFFVQYVCKPSCRHTMLSELQNSGVIQLIRQEKGCIQYHYYLDTDHEDILFLLEQWETLYDQQKHLRQEHMKIVQTLKEKYVLDTNLIRLEP